MFRLLGFPVHVRPGFVMFMVLIVVLYGNEFGLWLAGSLAAFTLLHELGHALAARRTGAEAEISLNFLAGYASYSPTRELSRAEQAGISVAGPGIQIVTSVAILVALGGNPLERSSLDESSMLLAIWWAGPVIGLFNLVPILPLDGGNIVMNGLDRLLPGRAQRIMLWASIAVTGSVGALAFVSDRYRGFIIIIGFLLVTQLQMLGSSKAPTSPWDDAHRALEAGKPRKARRILMTALSQHRPDVSPPQVRLSTDQVAALVALLPDPLPGGDPWNEYVLANQLMRLGRFEEAAHYAADAYGRHPHTLVAATVARAAGALGDQPTAVGWLRTAAEAGTSPAGLASVIDSSPELIGLRQHPEVQSIRRSLSLPHPDPRPDPHTTPKF
jgi:Zn-dependent protease